jgi:hypothetical protein
MLFLSQLVKKVPSGFFAKLLSELQNKFLYISYFAILPLRRGYWTRKETLTVSFHSFLPSDTFGLAVF